MSYNLRIFFGDTRNRITDESGDFFSDLLSGEDSILKKDSLYCREAVYYYIANSYLLNKARRNLLEKEIRKPFSVEINDTNINFSNKTQVEAINKYIQTLLHVIPYSDSIFVSSNGIKIKGDSFSPCIISIILYVTSRSLYSKSIDDSIKYILEVDDRVWINYDSRILTAFYVYLLYYIGSEWNYKDSLIEYSGPGTYLFSRLNIYATEFSDFYKKYSKYISAEGLSKSSRRFI